MHFLLMTFILFGLVIRNLFQRSLFQFLQTDSQHPEVQSVDEMLEQAFKFYIYPAAITSFDEILYLC